MQKKSLTLAILIPIFLVGCGGGGGGSNNLQPNPPAVESSLSSVPAQYRAAVQAAKTFNPMAVLEQDLVDDHNMVVKQITINGQILQNAQYSFSDLQNGFNNLAINVTYGTAGDDASRETATGNLSIYQQPYSVVIGSVFTSDTGAFADPDGFGVHYVDDVQGLKTASTAIDDLHAAASVFTYTGKAFNGQGQGDLTYQVDFGTREGSGTITGLAETGRIDLLAASIANLNNEIIKGNGISGKATFETAPGADINYELGFFGPKAEEIGGRISYANDADNINGISEVGFGGKR